MGINPAPNTCFLTGFPAVNIPSAVDCIDYYVDVYGKRYHCIFRWDYQNSPFIDQNRHIILGLFANNRFPVPEPKPFYDKDVIERIILEADYPKDPKAKMDNLLIKLSELQSFEGEVIDLSKIGSVDFFITKLFFKNIEEYAFYLRTLNEEGLITYIDESTKTSISFSTIRLTFSGLRYLIEIQNIGANSNYCFIAMSFSGTETEIRNTIKQVCLDTGFEPILVDELHLPSDETINDAILRHIKMCKFIIADFTKQKHGVYFEAGFGLGRGIPVIYTCSEEDFKNSHFDTNHYPHIVYSNLISLREQLTNKILAWIV